MSNVSTTTAAIYQAVLDSLNSSGECGVLPPAPPGKSAYEVAVDNGFVGSEKQWLNSLTVKQEQEIARLEARIVGGEKFTKDSNYAASRMIGRENGDVPAYWGTTGLSGLGYGGHCPLLANGTNLFSREWVVGFYNGNSLVNAPDNLTGWFFIEAIKGSQADRVMLRLTNYLSGYIYVAIGINGDVTSWSAWQKIIDSSLVGSDSKDKIPTVGVLQEALNSPLANGESKVGIEYDANDFGFGKHYTSGSTVNGIGLGFITTSPTSGNGRFQFFNGIAGLDLRARTRPNNSDVWTPWYKIYTEANTTKEAETGYLVVTSPVLKVQHDNFEKVHEAEQLDIDVQHLERGVYEITGTSGLREDDGWNLKPPKDVNGNVLCICEATESNGVITLKTYKKEFDFETVSIVADYEQPTDIPEGAEVMLRFNDLPQEELDEPEPR